MLTHAQNVFIGHYLGATALFWCWCYYQSNKQKKALRRLQRLRAEKNNSHEKYNTSS